MQSDFWDLKKTYIKGTDRIGRILKKHNIQTVFKPPKKIGQILKNFKDQRPPLNSARVYKIPCSCGKVYIGKTGKINIHMKEHQCEIKTYHTVSILLEYNVETDHIILFDKTTTIATTTSYFSRKYREAIKIQTLKNDHYHHSSSEQFTLLLSLSLSHIFCSLPLFH